jgi:hypothetical protein
MLNPLNKFVNKYSKNIKANEEKQNLIKNNSQYKETSSTDFTTDKNLVIIVNNSEIDINEESEKKQQFPSGAKPGLSAPSTINNFGEEKIGGKKEIKFFTKKINLLGKKIKDLTDEEKFYKNPKINQKETKNDFYLNKTNTQNKNEDEKNIKSTNINKNNNNNLGNETNEEIYLNKININEVELLHQTIEYKNKPLYNDPFDIINDNNKISDLFLIK